MAQWQTGTSKSRGFFLTILAILLTTVTSTYAARYMVTQILSPVPLTATAKGINKQGKITGTLTEAAFGTYSGIRTSRAFIYNNHSTALLPAPFGNSNGMAINGAGQVVGNASVGAYQHAMLWTGGLFQDLGVLPGTTNSSAYGVNDFGAVVGASGSYPFIWQNSVMTQLGTALGIAYSVNSSGVVAGSSNGAPAIWDINGNMTPLATTSGIAYRINDSGQVVGYLNANGYKGFLWQNGALQILPGSADLTGAFAISLNDFGAIVGLGNYSTAPYTRALLWENGAVLDLNTLIPADSGWLLTRAWDINAAGQIVGEGVYNGKTLAFLLSPSDQNTAPFTWPSIASGTSGCAGWYTSPVTVNLLAVDNSGSGIKEIHYSVDGATEVVVTGNVATVLLSGDGMHSILYYAVDNNGGVELVKNFTVTIDGTLPDSGAEIFGTPGANGWYKSPVTLKITGTDGTSGVSSIKYRKSTNGNWGSTITAPNPATISFGNFSTSGTTAAGRFQVGYNAVDRACNAEQEKMVAINIDSQAPFTITSISPVANASGWYTSDVTFNLTANDNLSGVDFLTINGIDSHVPTASFSVGEGTTTFTYGATDKAGNIEMQKAVTFRVDKAAPAVVLGTSPAALVGTSKSKLVPVTITGSATDALSGIATVTISITDEYGNYNFSNLSFGSTVNLDTLRKRNDTNGRVYTITATATDKAGNKTITTYSLIAK